MLNALMSDPSTKITRNDLEVITQAGTSPEIVSLLEQTVFGTKGKVRYRQKQISRGMALQKNLEFIQIKKGTRILGTAGVVKRDTLTLTRPIKSLYIRYLSILNAFQNKGTPNSPRKTSRRAGTLKTRVGEHITSHFEQPVFDENEKAVFYAFVESENYNSKELCISLGFHPWRKVSTLLFSRFFPKKSPAISVPAPHETEAIRTALNKYYRSHSFYFEDHLFDSGTCYVLKKDGKIVAGLRARPVNWEIIDVPGFNGFLMQHLLPYLPLTNRLFNPRDMNFISFDYLWHSEGNEELVLELMEHACAEKKIYMGMLWGDTDDKLTNFLKKSGKLGLLHSIQGAVDAEVLMRFINIDDAGELELKNTPVFVSAMDMT